MTQPSAPPRARRSEKKRLEDALLAQQAQRDAAAARFERPAQHGAVSDAYAPAPYGTAREGGAPSSADSASQPAAQTVRAARRGLPSVPRPTPAEATTQQQARVRRFTPETLDASFGTAYEPKPAQTRAAPRARPQAQPGGAPSFARAPEADALKKTRAARAIGYAAVGALALLVMIFAGLYISATGSLTRMTREREEAQSAYEALVSRHTVKYRDLVQRFAEENNLQPAYVAAIILRESSYDPNAVSSAGARGLMQLMPETAEWVAEKLNISQFTFDMMFDPETNIRFGTWYLGYLAGTGQFAGDPVLMACAYHAGQGNVRSWLGRYAGADGLLSIDEIPMDDTRSYAQKVLNAYAIYAQHAYAP